MKEHSFDIIGDIAILKFPKEILDARKKKSALLFLEKHRNINTILEKSDRIKGRLRIAKTRFLAGKNKKETTYIENECSFKLNVDETYFSPRLSNQRQLVTENLLKKVTSKKNKILVMFAGVGPFPIVIAKKLKKQGRKAKIVSNELNRKASNYMQENIRINKLNDYIGIIQCDAKKLPEKTNEKFDFIIMPRPNLKETFLETALKLSKDKTRIYYYGFGNKEDVLKELNKIKSRIKINKAGEIAPHKYRWLAEFSVSK